MQAFGLIGLLFGLVLIVVMSSLSGYLLGAVFVVIAAASGIAGAVLLRGHFNSATTSNNKGVTYLIFGTALIFSGAGLIVGSNIAFEYLISQMENTSLCRYRFDSRSLRVRHRSIFLLRSSQPQLTITKKVSIGEI